MNETWQDAARQNQGEAVLSDRVLGRDLWQSVGDDTVRQIYKRLIRRARGGTPVEFRYRCDAPARRRVFTMSIQSLADGQVEFASTLVQEEARPAVALLEAGRALPTLW